MLNLAFKWVGLCHIFRGFDQTQELSTHHFGQHACGHGVGRVVVANVDVQTVHHVEMRVGEQLLEGGIADLGRDCARHEGTEVGGRRELLRLLQRGRRWSWGGWG